MLTGISLYLVIIAVYVPGMFVLFRKRRFFSHPLITLAFLGMFIENALGSILVIFPEWVERPVYSPVVGVSGYFNWEFVGMLLIQALVFYGVCGLYLRYSPADRRPFRANPLADGITLTILFGVMLAIAGAWVARVGSPPFIEVLKGNLDAATVVAYRIESTYGIENYSQYVLGIYTLPVLLAGYTLTQAANTGRKPLYYSLLFLCVFLVLQPGQKGVVLDIAVVVVIALVLMADGQTNAPPTTIPYKKIFTWVGSAFVPVFFMYRVYFSNQGTGELFAAMFYRIVGVNSESMAASVLFARTYGFLEGASFPTVRGLFKHEQVNLSNVMHEFMFGPGGGVPISAFAEGYVNFGWVGFFFMALVICLVLVAFEELFKHLPRNVLTFSLLVLYAMWATKLSQVSLGATFVSLVYLPAFAAFLTLRGFVGMMLARRTPAPLMQTRAQGAA